MNEPGAIVRLVITLIRFGIPATSWCEDDNWDKFAKKYKVEL